MDPTLREVEVNSMDCGARRIGTAFPGKEGS